MKKFIFFVFLFVGFLGVAYVYQYADSYQGALGVLCLAPIWGGIFLSAAIACVLPRKEKKLQMAKKKR